MAGGIKRGNGKLGPDVWTWSTTAGPPESGGTCPGNSPGCWPSPCYGTREGGIARFVSVADSFAANAAVGVDIPALPLAGDFRLHVVGDFGVAHGSAADAVAYVDAWTAALAARPALRTFAYTRSWRLGGTMLAALERLRALDNVELFASLDATIAETPPPGWRVAYMAGDERATGAIHCPQQRAPGTVFCALADGGGCRFCLRPPVNARRDVLFEIH